MKVGLGAPKASNSEADARKQGQSCSEDYIGLEDMCHRSTHVANEMIRREHVPLREPIRCDEQL